MWVIEKESTNFRRKMWPWQRNKRVRQKNRDEIMGFETTSAKSKDIVLHDKEIFRPQKLNIKIEK